MSKFLSCLALCFMFSTAYPQWDVNKFAQLEQLLPTPNSYRTASGAPGKEYWQQKVDYKINVELEDSTQKLYGKESITYHNNSPDQLSYLWLQLDQNIREKDSDGYTTADTKIDEKMSNGAIKRLKGSDFDGGFKVTAVNAQGKKLEYTIVKTMMRVDLPSPLAPGASFNFDIEWWYNIASSRSIGGRGGHELFEKDSNYVYCIAQFFPRLCKYYDVYGWQNKQFLGRGEFTLEFGDYEVNITVPDDHIVASTGTLLNPGQVLSESQFTRFKKAQNEFIQPVVIATKEEADEKIKNNYKRVGGKKTWKFNAKNVRDWAFATSRRFIWDAMNTKLAAGSSSLAMSMYTKEGNCLWSKYSTKAVAHTLKTYSKYTVDYPYPCAWSIDGSMGMEYPMICFNNGRCEDDGTYEERMKYGHIGVIIHEVGHNFFPMIINSDERQWTWMDEGLNTFIQMLSQQEFERNYPGSRGTPASIADYMKSDPTKLEPIMTNSESINQFGNNAYSKPAAGLTILRETILGRELFDYAFKEYCKRWAFKTPTPADFFRTMEDASGVDLDWFWRGWFYTTDYVDLSIKEVKKFKLDSNDPNKKYELTKASRTTQPKSISDIRNATDIEQTYNERDTSLNDFYTQRDAAIPDAQSITEYQKYYNGLSKEEKEIVDRSDNYYEVQFERIGELPMPIIAEIRYKDGSTDVLRVPAEIWRMNNKVASKVIVSAKEIEKIVLDPFLETADVDRGNNYYPPQSTQSKFELFKQQREDRKSENPMQRNTRLKDVKP